MKGYLLNFYKYSPSFKSINYKESSKYPKSVVWSSFDRLEIREVLDFKDFRKSEEREKAWTGERQCAMLYELTENNTFLYNNIDINESIQKCRFPFSVKSCDSEMRFFGITFIDFVPYIHKLFYNSKNKKIPGELIHNSLDKTIISIKKNLSINQELYYEIFGVLGGQDAVIIWMANQFSDIIKVTRELRSAQMRENEVAISNIYTIIGLTDANNVNTSYDDTQGEIRVKLTKREHYCIDNIDFSKFNNNKEISLLFGEHDLEVLLDNKSNLGELYREEGILNPNTEIFQQNFIQSKTEILVKNEIETFQKEKTQFFIPEGLFENKEFFELEIINPILEELLYKITETKLFNNTLYLKETLWLLYEDYHKNRNSSLSYPWTADLEFQFKKGLEFIKALTESDLSNEQKYDNIKRIMDGMHQMILHVAQANRLFFEVPNTHLKNTGTYSKILRAYYGIIKQYLKLAYSIPRDSKQSTIIPFISFDITPIAQSYSCVSVNSFNGKIVHIKLPYEALVDIIKYKDILAHEIYHYIAPTNRTIRNTIIMQLSLATFTSELIGLYLKEEAFPIIKYNYDKHFVEKDIELLNKKLIHIVQQLIGREIAELSKDVILNFIYKWIPNYTDDHEWFDFNKKLVEYFIGQLNNPDSITIFINHIIQKIDINESLSEKQIKKEEKELICKYLNFLKDKGEQDFRKWINIRKPIKDISTFDEDLRYILRETMADYFMVQSTRMDIHKYINYIYGYKDIVDNNVCHIRQRYRIVILLSYIIGKEIECEEFINAESPQIQMQHIIRYLCTKRGFSKEEKNKLKFIAEAYVECYYFLMPYRKLINQYFESINFSTLSISSIFKNELDNTYKLLSSSTENEDFDECIHIIECLQKQETFEEIEQKREDNIITCSKTDENEPIRFDEEILMAPPIPISSTGYSVYKTVGTMAELFNMINKAKKDITDADETNFSQIWYRGHINKDYLLIPTLYRMKDLGKEFYTKTKLRDVQISLMDTFKAKAYNAPELYDKGVMTDINCLISMQHYRVPTNILDWSTSVLVGLYFALESCFDKKVDKPKKDAALYLLNPIRLNNAIQLIQRKVPGDEYPIPVFVGDSSRFEEYIPVRNNKNYPEAIKNTQYPKAVYVPLINQHIKAQLGTFVAFGLDNAGNITINNGECHKDYSKLSLYDIQEEYKVKCHELGIVPKLFLSEVYIDNEKREEISSELKTIGVCKELIYPDLDYIGESLKNEFRDYFSKKDSD